MTEHQHRIRSSPWLSAAVHAEAMRSLPVVAEVMSKHALAVTEDMPGDVALQLLQQRSLPGAPVVRGATPVGVVSVFDLADTGAASCDDQGYPLYYRHEDIVPGPWVERVPAARPVQVGDVMHPFVLSIEASANLVQAAHRMLSENVRRLLVRDGTDLAGVVTAAELLGGIARWFSPEVALGARAAGMGPGLGERAPAGPE